MVDIPVVDNPVIDNDVPMEPPNPTLVIQGIANQLPNSDKFANITRPLIAANCNTLARKNKLNMGSHSKPRDKVDQVSKIIIKL